jgi:thiosulfate dehydrogenase [quinone] large subunit
MDTGTMERNRDIALAYFLLRATVGVNIAFHGVSRILAGPANFASTLVPLFQKTLLPVWSVLGFGLALPWVEAVLGILVLAGLRTRIALIGCGLLILVLTFGSCLRQDWAGAGAQLLYAAIFSALLAFRDRNEYALDAWWQRRSRARS